MATQQVARFQRVVGRTVVRAADTAKCCRLPLVLTVQVSEATGREAAQLGIQPRRIKPHPLKDEEAGSLAASIIRGSRMPDRRGTLNLGRPCHSATLCIQKHGRPLYTLRIGAV